MTFDVLIVLSVGLIKVLYFKKLRDGYEKTGFTFFYFNTNIRTNNSRPNRTLMTSVSVKMMADE